MNITSDVLKELTGKCNPDIMKKCGVETFVEIGIREGTSFMNHVKGVSKTAYAIDIWRDTGNNAQNDGGYSQSELNNQYNRFINKIKNIETPEIIVYRDFSIIVANGRFTDNSIDWVFIDGDHSYEGCKGDIETWYNKVRRGGVLSGHDYMFTSVKWNGVECGVKQAVDEFVEKHNLDLFVYKNSPNPSWYLIK